MDALYKGRIKGDAKRVTAGDPQYFANRQSDDTANTGRRPQLPGKGAARREGR